MKNGRAVLSTLRAPPVYYTLVRTDDVARPVVDRRSVTGARCWRLGDDNHGGSDHHDIRTTPDICPLVVVVGSDNLYSQRNTVAAINKQKQ